MEHSSLDGEKAFQIHSCIIKNEEFRRKNLWDNVYLLKQIKNNNLYKVIVGDENAEWVAYLGQLETFYTRNSIYEMIRIYDKFVETFKLDIQDFYDIPVSRLSTLLSISNENNIKDLLVKARVLTRRDFNDEIRELKGLPTTDNCKHSFIDYKICSVCGEKHKTENHYETEK